MQLLRLSADQKRELFSKLIPSDEPTFHQYYHRVMSSD